MRCGFDTHSGTTASISSGSGSVTTIFSYTTQGPCMCLYIMTAVAPLAWYPDNEKPMCFNPG